jgi:SAM-dependent methyltransferase
MYFSLQKTFVDYETAALAGSVGSVDAAGRPRFGADRPRGRARTPAVAAEAGDAAAAADAFEAACRGRSPLALSMVRRGQTVLDLGCGAGADLMRAAARVGPAGKVIGVEARIGLIERAARSVEAAGYANVEIRRGCIEALPLADASVDWVISNGVINLSNQKDKVFAEIFRVLKPGGRVMVSAIVADSLPAWIRRSAILTAACVGAAISESACLAGLSAAGFASCHVVDRTYCEPTQLARRLRRALLPRQLAGGVIARWVGAATETLARSIAGRVWSARVHARKRREVPWLG